VSITLLHPRVVQVCVRVYVAACALRSAVHRGGPRAWRRGGRSRRDRLPQRDPWGRDGMEERGVEERATFSRPLTRRVNGREKVAFGKQVYMRRPTGLHACQKRPTTVSKETYYRRDDQQVYMKRNSH